MPQSPTVWVGHQAKAWCPCLPSSSICLCSGLFSHAEFCKKEILDLEPQCSGGQDKGGVGASIPAVAKDQSVVATAWAVNEFRSVFCVFSNRYEISETRSCVNAGGGRH